MRKSENGRSMIEMLGVLAIIGVLSVGGIYGYTTAMRKYKANEIAQTVSMLATMAHAKNAGQGGQLYLNASGLEKAPAGVALANTTANTGTVANCVTTAGETATAGTCPLVKITLANTDSNSDWANIKKAVCQIVPKAAGDSTTAAGRAGYYVDCS